MEGYKRIKMTSRFPRGAYLDALLLSERHQKKEIFVEVEKVPLWREVVRVSEKVVRRRGK